MSDSLIEQVKRLAEFQERVGVCPGWEKHQFSMLLGGTIYRGTIDFPALLAHMQAQQAMVAEAREERVEAAKRLSRQAARWLDDFIADSELIDAINGELDAALENLENNDGK